MKFAHACAWASLWLVGQEVEDAAPTTARVKLLVERAFELDLATAEGRSEQGRILDELDRMREPSAGAMRTWRERLLEFASDLPRIETSDGAHYFYDDNKGLYLVRGDTSSPKGLLVRLHGSGALKSDQYRANEDGSKESASRDWLVVMPARQGEGKWWSEAESERFVIELVDAALRTFEIDPNHVYLTGDSAGGMGTWDVGSRHADRFAWLLPIAGAPSPTNDGLADGVLPNLRNTPMVVYHSLKDPRVPFAPTKAELAKFDLARERWGGFTYELVTDPNPSHGFPKEGRGVLFDRLDDVVRDPRPTKLVWQPTSPTKRQFAWLWWREPVIGALIVAELDRNSNSVAVTTEGVATGLEVLLDDDLLALDREVVVTLNGAEVFRGVPPRRLSVLVATGCGGHPEHTFEASVKLP